jgi:phage baseplate assembly protein W
MITTQELEKIIGTGIQYPLSFSNNGQNELLELQSGIGVINQSIFTILSTPIGERFNNPEFGSNLNTIIFEPNDNITKDLCYYYTVTALSRWEKRITITGIDFIYNSNDDHFIGMYIKYLINETNIPGSYVFPFSVGGEPMSSLNTGTVQLGL